jgi:hypothetical protein
MRSILGSRFNACSVSSLACFTPYAASGGSDAIPVGDTIVVESLSVVQLLRNYCGGLAVFGVDEMGTDAMTGYIDCVEHCETRFEVLC